MGNKKKKSKKALSQAELNKIDGGLGPTDVAHRPMQEIEMTTFSSSVEHPEEQLRDNPPPKMNQPAKDGMEIVVHNKFMTSSLALPHPSLTFEHTNLREVPDAHLRDTQRAPLDSLNRSLVETATHLQALHVQTIQNPTPQSASSFLDTAKQMLSSLFNRVSEFLGGLNIPASMRQTFLDIADTLKEWGGKIASATMDALAWVKENGSKLLNALANAASKMGEAMGRAFGTGAESIQPPEATTVTLRPEERIRQDISQALEVNKQQSRHRMIEAVNALVAQNIPGVTVTKLDNASASEDDIGKAYKGLMLRVHTDKLARPELKDLLDRLTTGQREYLAAKDAKPPLERPDELFGSNSGRLAPSELQHLLNSRLAELEQQHPGASKDPQVARMVSELIGMQNTATRLGKQSDWFANNKLSSINPELAARFPGYKEHEDKVNRELTALGFEMAGLDSKIEQLKALLDDRLKMLPR